MVRVASKTFDDGFGTYLTVAEKNTFHPTPKNKDIGGVELSTQPILTIFGPKNVLFIF